MAGIANGSDRLVFEFRDVSDMVVCGTCGLVRGMWRYASDVYGYGLEDRYQWCWCDVPDGKPPRGRGYDQAVELCSACAAGLVPYAERWTVILCPDCKRRCLALWRREGYFVVPIGRHSLMNRVCIPGRVALRSPAAVADFAQEACRFARRAASMQEWRTRRTLAHIESIGRAGASEVPLAEYLTRLEGLPVDKKAIFAALCQDRGVDPPREPRRRRAPGKDGER